MEDTHSRKVDHSCDPIGSSFVNMSHRGINNEVLKRATERSSREWHRIFTRVGGPIIDPFKTDKDLMEENYE